MTNRMIEAAKGILLKYIPDVFILTDHRKGPASGLSPGFGITLTAETINGTFNRTTELRFILLNITLFLI